MSKRTFSQEYDYMFKQLIAQMPVTGCAWLRPYVEKWWKRLCKLVEEKKE